MKRRVCPHKRITSCALCSAPHTHTHTHTHTHACTCTQIARKTAPWNDWILRLTSSWPREFLRRRLKCAFRSCSATPRKGITTMLRSVSASPERRTSGTRRRGRRRRRKRETKLCAASGLCMEDGGQHTCGYTQELAVFVEAIVDRSQSAELGVGLCLQARRANMTRIDATMRCTTTTNVRQER